MVDHEVKLLLRQAKEGDVAAFAEVFEALRPLIHTIAYRLVGADDADDVVMETYLKAWGAVQRFNERSSLKTWLYRIAYNCALDFIRARKRSRLVVLPEDDLDDRSMAEVARDQQPLPGEQLVKSEISDMVSAALDRLDAHHRTVLLLRFRDGLSYKDIAAATGAGIGTVMSRLFNGKKRLREAVNGLMDDD